MDRKQIETLMHETITDQSEFEEKLNKLVGITDLKTQIETLSKQVSDFGKTKEIIEGKIKSLKSKNIIDDKNLELEIKRHASKLGAYNSDQIFSLVRDKFSKGKDGKFISTDGKNIEAYIREYLSDPSNDNLCLSTVKDGSGNSIPNERTKPQFRKEDIAQAAEHGLPVKRFLEIKRKRILKQNKLKRSR